MKKLALEHRIRPPKYPSKVSSPITNKRPPLLIFLHGVGGSENELFNELSQEIDDRFLLISVRAPYAPSPNSFAWYRVSPFLDDRNVNATDTESSRQVLVQFIQESVIAYEADPAQVYLFGFNQGATICLSVLMTEVGLLAGVVASSGQVLSEITHLVVEDSRFQDFPVFLNFGLHDQVLPIQTGRRMRELFSKYGFDLYYREYPVGHYLSTGAIRDASAWLTKHLNANRRRWFSSRTNTRIHLGHVRIRVRNLDRAIVFYKRFLGLRLAEQVGKGYAFLTGGYAHHEIALQNVGSEALDVPPNSVGVAHVAFEVPDLSVFAQAYKALVDGGIKVKTADNFISWSIQFQDPDGNELVIYCDTRDLPGRSDLWQGRDLPLPADQILANLEL